MVAKIEKTYGRLRLDPKSRRWVVSDVAPNIALRIKDIFRRISKVDSGEFFFADDDLHALELLWFMDRHPLEVSKLDLARLKAGRKRYYATAREVETIFAPDFKAPEYVGLAEGCALWGYQAQAVEMFRKVKRLLLGDDIGLGKTNTAIGCMLGKGMLPCAVIVQAHLTEQWAERVEDFSSLRVHVVRTVAAYELPPADVYVFSYNKTHGWVDLARTGYFKLVVLDEPQELRGGFFTQKGTAARRFCEAAKAVLGLTASPVMNYGVEMFHVMEFISPGSLGTLEEFLREWCSDDRVVKDPDALGAFLREQMLLLRRTEDDVGQQMPQPNVTTHDVAYDKSRAQESEDLAYRLAIRATSGVFSEMGTAYRELDALTRLTTGVAKAEGVAEYARILLEADLPVLLSAWHRDVYDIFNECLKDFRPVMYTGSESKVQKRRAKQAFASGDTNLMMISNRSGAGLDGLQFRCADVVISELDWSPMILKQLVGRLRRTGQKDVVNVHYMIADGGSDPLMVEVLGLKSGQSHGIMNPYTQPAAQVSDESRMRRLAQMVLERRQTSAAAA